MRSPGSLSVLATLLFLPASAPGATTLAANPTSVTFAGNACFAQTQTVQITASDHSSIKVTASLSTGSGYAVTSSSAQTAAAVTTLTITAFSSASSTGTIKVSSTGLADLNLPVSFTLGIGPFALALCGQTGPVTKLPVPFSGSAADKATPITQDVTLTASGSGSHKFTSFTDVKWLSISPDSGTVTGGDTTGVDIQVIVDYSGMPHNQGKDYPGNVTISAGGQSVTIAVTLSVTGCDVTVTPQPIPNVTPGHQVKGSITLGVDVNGAENVTFAPMTSDGGKWVTVTNSNSPSNTSSATIPPDNLVATVDATNLKPGDYSFTIAVGNCNPAPCTTAYKTIPVTVAAATLNAGSLSPFTGTAANPPAAQNVQITASDGSAVTFAYTVTLDNGLTWLQVKPTGNLMTPVSLSLMAVPGTLAAGTYKGAIQLTPSNGAAPLLLSVLLNIIPTVSANKTSLSFPAPGSTPLQQIVSLTSDSTVGIGFSLTATTADGMKWLNATAAVSTVPTTLTVTVSPTGLKPGNYNGTIHVAPNGGPAPVDIGVTYAVGAAAVLAIDTSTIVFSGQAGGSSCGQIMRTIQSSDVTVVLAYQASAAVTTPAGSNWLTVRPLSGNAPDTLTISCGTGTLGAGSYSGTINVSIPNSPNPAIAIPVTLNVGAAPITPSTTSLNFDYNNTTSASASGLAQVVNLTSPTPVNFTAAVTSGQSWISVLPAAGVTNGSIKIAVDPTRLIASATAYPGKVTVGSGATSTDINISFQISGIPRLTRVAPLYLDGGGLQTSYLLLNPTINPANYSISLAGATPMSGIIPPQSSYAQQTPGTAGQVSAGWSEISFDSGVGGLGLTQFNSGLSQESVIPLLAVPLTHFFVPFDNTNGRATSLNVVERAPGVTATCQVNGWTSVSGNTQGVAQFQAAPRASQMFDTRLWDGFNNAQGVAELICDQPVFASVVRANPSGNVAVHDVAAAGPGDRTTITRQIPAVLDGSAHQTILALVNTDNIDQAYSFQFWSNRNGGALASPLEAQTTGSISPGGVLFLATDGSGAASAPLAQLAGPLPFAELTAARTVAAFVIYQQGTDGSTISAEAAVPVVQTAAGHWTAPISSTNGFSTAVSVVNSNNGAAANLTLTYYVGGGATSEFVSVPAGGSVLLQTATDPVAAGLDGILDLVSDQSVNATVFRIAPNGSFAAFPALAGN